jgi:hypothetical protein
MVQLLALQGSQGICDLERECADTSNTNILEVLESVGRIDGRQEHLHSRLLGFFLDPTERRHQLDDRFVRAILSKVEFYRDGKIQTRISNRGLGLTRVKREKVFEAGRADFVFFNELKKFAVVVEIKVGHSESPNQLEKYWESAVEDYKDYAIGGLFITPDGKKPTSAGSYKYVSLRYADIAGLLDEAAKEIPAVAKSAVNQYSRALRRWFVSDTNKEKLAWALHSKFPNALDYLINYPTSPIRMMHTKMCDLINTGDELKIVFGDKPKEDLFETHFVPKKWERIQRFSNAGSRDPAMGGRLLTFSITWEPSSYGDESRWWRELCVYLGIPEGSPKPEAGEALIAIRKAKTKPSTNTLVPSDGVDIERWFNANGWTNLWARRLAGEQELKWENRDTLFELIDKRWKGFIEKDLPEICEALAVHFSSSIA